MARKPAKKKVAKKAPAKRKAPAKKAAKKTAKRKVAKKAAAPAKNLPAIKTKMTKTQILNELAESTELSRKQVASVLEELESLIERHIKKRGVGEFTLPGLLTVSYTHLTLPTKRIV